MDEPSTGRRSRHTCFRRRVTDKQPDVELPDAENLFQKVISASVTPDVAINLVKTKLARGEHFETEVKKSLRRRRDDCTFRFLAETSEGLLVITIDNHQHRVNCSVLSGTIKGQHGEPDSNTIIVEFSNGNRLPTPVSQACYYVLGAVVTEALA